MMKKRLIGFILITLMLLSVGSVFAGGRPDTFRGQTLVIGNWWEDWNVNTYKPRTEIESQQNEHRRRIQRDNNFLMQTKVIAGWGEMLETTVTNIMSGNRNVHAYWLSPDWAYTLYKQGLLAPLNTGTMAATLKNRTEVAMQRTAYNAMIEELFTFNGKQYGLSIGPGGGSWSGSGVYFNKRILREAGIDPDLPYNMQRDNTWTWAAFLDLCKRLTRDINNDGIIDIWATTTDHQQSILEMLVFSNNAEFVSRDPRTGRFANATNTPAFIEALQFYRRLMDEGVMKPIPEGSNWDWYWSEFYDGRIAFMLEPEWRRGQMTDMKDDWGFVFPPRGPRASQLRMGTSENVLVIPAFFNQAEVDAILRAVDLWYVPITNNWKEGHYPFFRDRRAVDETMERMRNPRNMVFRNNQMIPGLNTGDFAWQIAWVDGDPAQLVEANRLTWNALISDANE